MTGTELIEFICFDFPYCRDRARTLSASQPTLPVPGVSATTSLRRIGELATGGYVDRTPDTRDGRRDFVTLTVKARGLLADYLANVNSCLTDLLSNDTPVSAAARSSG